MRTVVSSLPAREAEVGGLSVLRALPRKALRRVGPFVFADHFRSPAEVPLDVPAHPHVGLQTVTYLFSGGLRHRDSEGFDQEIWPGDVNWMTSGRGIVHSEVSIPKSGALHGFQTWVALPASHRRTEPTFRHHEASSLPSEGPLRVLAGRSGALVSPIPTFSGVTLLEVMLPPGGATTIETDPGDQLAIYVVDGEAIVGDAPVRAGTLAELSEGSALSIEAAGATRVMVLGGAPLPDPVVTYWNFVVDCVDEGRALQADWNEGRFPISWRG